MDPECRYDHALHATIGGGQRRGAGAPAMRNFRFTEISARLFCLCARE
jgi:hypothetical protein